MPPNKSAAIFGAVVGLVLSVTILVVIPMRQNLKDNGCVWIECAETEGAKK